MHNLHFIVIKAASPQKACDTVESEIQDWGNENNWRNIIGCVSEDDILYNNPHDSSSHFSEEGIETIEKINKWLDQYVKADLSFNVEYIEKVLERYKNKDNTLAVFDFFNCKTLMNEIYKKYSFNKEDAPEFNVLEHEIFSWELDEFGVTHLSIDENIEGYKKYVVVIDMHS